MTTLREVKIKSSIDSGNHWSFGNLAFIDAAGNHINPTAYPGEFNQREVNFDNGFSVQMTGGSDPQTNWGHLGNLLLASKTDESNNFIHIKGDGSGLGHQAFWVGLKRDNEVTITLPENSNIHALVYMPWVQYTSYDRNYDTTFELYFGDDTDATYTYTITSPENPADKYRALILSNGTLSTELLSTVTEIYHDDSGNLRDGENQALGDKIEVDDVNQLATYVQSEPEPEPEPEPLPVEITLVNDNDDTNKVNVGTNFSDPGATTNADGVTATVTVIDADGVVLSSVDTSVVGTYTLTYSADGATENKVRTVTVLPTVQDVSTHTVKNQPTSFFLKYNNL